MAGTSNLTWNNCYLFFFRKLPHYPFGSKPNTVACSKFEFLFDCQKDIETAMRLMYRVHFENNRFRVHSYLTPNCTPLQISAILNKNKIIHMPYFS